MTFCRNCGKPISEENAFCPHCGTHIAVYSRPAENIPPTMAPRKNGSSAKKIAAIAIAVIMLVIIGVFIFNSLGSSNALTSIVDPPRPQVTSINGHESIANLDYTYKVDVTVKNNGGEGDIEVFAEINGAGKYEQQSKTVHLAKGESKSMQFTFDLSVWGTLGQPTISYRAWANAK